MQVIVHMWWVQKDNAVITAYRKNMFVLLVPAHRQNKYVMAHAVVILLYFSIIRRYKGHHGRKTIPNSPFLAYQLHPHEAHSCNSPSPVHDFAWVRFVLFHTRVVHQPDYVDVYECVCNLNAHIACHIWWDIWYDETDTEASPDVVMYIEVE